MHPVEHPSCVATLPLDLRRKREAGEVADLVDEEGEDDRDDREAPGSTQYIHIQSGSIA